MDLEKLRADLGRALKQKKSLKVGTLRLLLAEIHNKELEKQAELTGEEVLAVIRKEVKKRKEAIEAYKQGKRDDLVQKESQELEVLEKYLPQEISSKELEKIVKETMGEMGEVGEKDFGKVMGSVMGKVKERADGKTVAEKVKTFLK